LTDTKLASYFSLLLLTQNFGQKTQNITAKLENIDDLFKMAIMPSLKMVVLLMVMA
jgi:hypothetical protein